MKKDLKKQVASVALSMAIAGSSAAAMSAPVYAEDEETNLKQVEQSIDEDIEEAKEEVQEEVQEENEVEAQEIKEEVQEEKNEEVEEAKQETKDEVQEETKDEVQEETKDEVQEETKEEVKEENKQEAQEEPKEEKEEINKEVSKSNDDNSEKENDMVQVTRTVVPKTSENPTSEEHKVSVITTKVDENGKPLSGAVLQILDSEGNVVDEWISDGNEHESMLPEGEYILHEKSAPDGYKVAADKSFTIKVEVIDLNAGVDYSETPCSHYGGTPLYYVESGGEKQEVYCINQDWETPDDNSVYDGKIIKPTDINSYTRQTIYVDSHQNKESADVSDQSLTSQELYDKVLDIVYHRQRASELFSDLTEAEIRFVTESALKNYTNAGLTRVQRVAISQAPTGYEKTDYYITDDGKYMWYLYPWYRSFVYDPDAPLGKDVYRTDIGNGDAFGTLARHWSSGHNGKNSAESRAKLARYYELYQYLVNGRERHPEDMHLYIFYTNNKASDLSGYDFDGGSYQHLLGIRWFDPQAEEYKVYLIDVNNKIITPPEKPDKPYKPEKPEKPVIPEKPEKPVIPETPTTVKTSTITSNNTSPQTGDDTLDLELALAGLGVSTMALGGMVRVRRREYKK